MILYWKSDVGCGLFIHCVKSFQIQSFFWSVFSRIRTEYGEIQCFLFSPNTGKCRPEKKILVWTLLTEWYIHTNYSKCSSFPKSTIILSNKSFAIFYSEFLRVCHSQLVLRCHKEIYSKIGSAKQPIAAWSTWLIYLLSKKWCRHYLMKVCFHEKNILNGYIKLT